jgi:hypothetical protein
VFAPLCAGQYDRIIVNAEADQNGEDNRALSFPVKQMAMRQIVAPQ